MKVSNILSILCLLATSRSAFADEEFEYEDLLSTPTKVWSATLFPDTELGAVQIEAGNGVFMAPDGKHALVTTVGATVYAFNAYSGEQKWVYQAEAEGNTIVRSHSGVTFSPGSDYMVYAVVDNENSMSPISRVIALDMTGKEIWISDDLEGVAAGNPQVSSDGAYVFLTHNADELTNGYFTILDGETGAIFYGGSSGEGGDVPTKSYGPVGIYHTPDQGNYDPIVSGAQVSEGDFNQNDMLMWSQQPKPTDETIQNGFIYGFQFPRDFAGNASDVKFFQLGIERDFQAIIAPVMGNGGMSAYWGISRGGFQGWVSHRFSRNRNAVAGFTRNTDFAGQPVWAQPALSNDGPEPTIFGGTSAREFVRMSYDFDDQFIVPTEGYVKVAAAVDGDERVVYYVEDNGTIHMADFDTLQDLWTDSMGFTVTGEMALTPRSDILLVTSGRGVISAYQVAEIPVTEAPSDMPSDYPSMEPTGAPTISRAPVVTEPPTMAPTTEAPEPTDPPVEPPVEPMPVEPMPVSMPVAANTEPPSGSSSRSIFLASAAFVVAAVLL